MALCRVWSMPLLLLIITAIVISDTSTSSGLCGVNSPSELVAAYSNLIRGKSDDDLARLVANREDNTCIAAAWERVRRTIPAAQYLKSRPIDKSAIQRFLGVLEGRLAVHPPEAWERAMIGAHHYGRSNLSFDQIESSPLPMKGEAGLSRGADIQHVRNRYIIKTDKQEWSIDERHIMGTVDAACACRGDKVTYVAAYGWPPNPFSIIAFDNQNGSTVWTNRVWAAAALGNYSGRGWHSVYLYCSGERLCVFGISENDTYIEIFSAADGRNQFRFGSVYFRDASGPK